MKKLVLLFWLLATVTIPIGQIESLWYERGSVIIELSSPNAKDIERVVKSTPPKGVKIATQNNI